MLRIVDILTSCPHVETITVLLDNSFLGHEHNRPIIGAISAMQSLHSLRIQGEPNDALALLCDVKSPLRRLDIQSHSSRNGSRFWTPLALEDVLPRLALTLEDLEVTGLLVDPEGVQRMPRIVMPPLSTMTQYAAVRSLTVGCFLGRPFLDQLQHLFPALNGTLALHHFNTLSPEEAYADIRATNLLVQETYESGPTCSRGWRSLDRVICSAPMLYMLGLCCPIRLVRLYQCTSDDLHYAADSLRENPVPRLVLSLPLVEELRGLDTLFSPELAGWLTHLTLRLVYTHEEALWTNRSADIVARLPWSHFLVCALACPVRECSCTQRASSSHRPSWYPHCKCCTGSPTSTSPSAPRATKTQRPTRPSRPRPGKSSREPSSHLRSTFKAQQRR